MSMGIVSNEEFENELNKHIPSPIKREVIIPEIVKENEKGRGKGNVEVPNSLRKLIGDTSISEGRGDALQLGKQFGISSSSVSAYSNGSTSTTTYDKQPNNDVINQAKNRISKKARSKLIKALDHITEDKLSVAKLRDVSGVARDMSAIIKNMEPDTRDPNLTVKSDKPTIVIYNPQLKTEEDYEAITIRE